MKVNVSERGVLLRDELDELEDELDELDELDHWAPEPFAAGVVVLEAAE